MRKTMKAVIKKSLARGVYVEDVPIPEIDDNGVLLKVRAAGVCGSDVHMYEGAESYRAFEASMPFIIGHEFSGEVAKVGKNVKKVKQGDRVVSYVAPFCGKCHYCTTRRSHLCPEAMKRALGLGVDGGFAEYVAVTEDYCIPLPDNVSYEMGALIEPLGVAGNAVNDSGLTMGETVVIQGPGPIGLLTLIMAKARGAGKCIVIGTKKDAMRLAKAKEIGADHIIVAEETDVVKAVKDITNGYGADVVFEVTGVPQLIQTALDMCDLMGRVVVEGIYGSSTTVNFTPMVRSGKKLIGTYGGVVAWERMLAWLQADSYYAKLPTSIVTHRCKLDDATAAFERSINKESIKEIFTMD